MSLTKHKFEELELSNLSESCKHAIVHGVVTELSPVKQSAKNCKYFQAQLSDGKKTIKVVGFDPALHQSMNNSQKDRKPIKVTNCRLKNMTRMMHKYS